jgi:hypothetical protein
MQSKSHKVVPKAGGGGGNKQPSLVVQRQALDSGAGEVCWSTPPGGGAGDEPFWVDFRFNKWQVKQINTVERTTTVSIVVVFFWTDPRLVGWDVAKQLPHDLWGPYLVVENGSCEWSQNTFALLDPASGRLKRGTTYSGDVETLLCLRDFPFDVDRVDLAFSCMSHWRTLDGEQVANCPRGRTYRLRPTRQKGEGKWLGLYFSSFVPEWQLLGVSTVVDEQPTNANGVDLTQVSFSFHVHRKSGFFVWKVLVPLYVLIVLCFSGFLFDTADLPGRMGHTMTGFLAAAATLYVVGESLPKVDFLTKIDQMVTSCTLLLAFMAISFCIIGVWQEEYGEDWAKRWNWIAAAALGIFFVLSNLMVFLPPVCRKCSRVKSLRSGYDGTPSAPAGSRPYLVQENAKYSTIAAVLTLGMKDKSKRL